jgi:DNA-binding LacI/PurR family transcriptional regulator
MTHTRAPRLEHIADELRKEIRTRCEPGARLPSIDKLCREFGVSVNTMRIVLAALSGEGWVELRHGKGVFVREHKRSLTVAVVSDQDLLATQISSFFTQMTRSLRSFLAEQGAKVRVYIGTIKPGSYDTHFTCDDFLEDLAAGRIDAVAVVSTFPKDELMKAVESAQVPLVGPLPFFAFGTGVDFQGVIREGLRRLHERGRRRIAIVGWNASNPWDVFRVTMNDMGLEVREKWIRNDFSGSFPGNGWEDFREIWTAYPEKPDGLLVMDDFLFLDMRSALLSMHIRIPEHLWIVSLQNRDSLVPSPFPVTVAEADPTLIGEEHGRLLLKLIRHERIAQPQILAPVRWVEPAVGPEPSVVPFLASAQSDDKVPAVKGGAS